MRTTAQFNRGRCLGRKASRAVALHGGLARSALSGFDPRPALLLIVALGLLVSVTAGVAQAYDTSGAAHAIPTLNEQRAANGIPPVMLDQTLLRTTCTIQNHHIASPWSSWSASSSPWDEAPLHQSILYNPAEGVAAYGVYGANESSFAALGGPSWTCMWFTWDWTAPSPTGAPTFYAFTADQGRSDVPVSENANEWPTTPAAMVGLASETGPNLLVYALGIGASPHIIAATLALLTVSSWS
jgi:hypothetical protein